MADRWNGGKPDKGEAMHPGFISPLNQNVRNFSEYESIQTVVPSKHPATMAEQMDGDQGIGWGGNGGKK
jgi:hypothetical protein